MGDTLVQKKAPIGATQGWPRPGSVMVCIWIPVLVPTVPLGKEFLCKLLRGKQGSGSGFGPEKQLRQFQFPFWFPEKRDDNKNKICAFQGGMGKGAGKKIVQNAIFHGKRHDNKILKLQILLSRNFVVIAQAPFWFPEKGSDSSGFWFRFSS